MSCSRSFCFKLPNAVACPADGRELAPVFEIVKLEIKNAVLNSKMGNDLEAAKQILVETLYRNFIEPFFLPKILLGVLSSN